MLKDILGEVLNARQGKALTVTINVEPDEKTPEQTQKIQGLAPSPEDEEKVPTALDDQHLDGDLDSDISLVDTDEEQQLKRKMGGGMRPQSLGERAKMNSIKK